MRFIGATVLFVAVLGVWAGDIKLTEDKPLCPKPKAGNISGRLIMPEVSKPKRKTESGDEGKVYLPESFKEKSLAGESIELRAVSRVTGKSYKPHSYDEKTGKFVFKKLPGDAKYDICFEIGRRKIEGIDLDFVDQRLIRLADKRRKQLGLKPQRRHDFTMHDVKAILDYVRQMKEFMEIRRVLYIRGQGRRATLLVELMRTRKFHAAAKSECIWRIELWYFVNQFGGWDKLANQERVLGRVRAQADEWKKISVEYYPALSVYVSSTGKSTPIKFKIPPKPDPSRGRPPATPPKIKTPPHILGLDKKTKKAVISNK